MGELTVAVSQAAERVACDAHAGRGVVEESLEARNAVVSENLGRIPVEGDSSHVGRAEKALTRAGSASKSSVGWTVEAVVLVI